MVKNWKIKCLDLSDGSVIYYNLTTPFQLSYCDMLNLARMRTVIVGVYQYNLVYA